MAQIGGYREVGLEPSIDYTGNNSTPWWSSTGDFDSYLKDNGVTDFMYQQMTPDAQKAISSGFNDLNSWSLDNVTDGLGKLSGIDMESLKGLGSLVNGVMKPVSTVMGMLNQNEMTGMAKDNYKFQKKMQTAQWDEAMKDKAEFKANQAAATKKYYGNG